MSEWNAEAAEWYAENYGEYATNRLGVDALELDSVSTVVDVGCGTGAALRHLASKNKEATLIGIEPVERMIQIAKERLRDDPNQPQIEFRQGTAESLPVDTSTVDLVLAFDSFDHWNEQEIGLAEVRRVLRSRGKFVVVKDGGIPDRVESRTLLLKQLSKAEFTIEREEDFELEGVEFTLWVCIHK